MKYDVVIIGGGPAGLTAAIYASRANLKTIFVEKGAPGGKIVKTSKIENWTGDKTINGPDLSLRMFEHAQAFGGEYKYGDVTEIKTSGEFSHEVVLSSGDIIKAKAVIIATGMVEIIPESVENIHRLENKGISYCAICDGPLYKGDPVAVIGGGNSAIEEATYLASIATKVYIFVRDGVVATKALIEELESKNNVEIINDVEVTKILGEDKVKKIVAVSLDKKTTYEKEVSAVFPYIGQRPITGFAKNLGITNKQGYIKTDELMETSAKGIYAIGDVREKHIRQIATAVADGAIAGKIIANKI